MGKYSRQIFLFILLLPILILISYYDLLNIGSFEYLIGSLGVLTLVGILVMRNIISKTNSQEKWYQQKIYSNTQAIIDMKEIGEMAINEFPFGIIMYDEDYSILWINSFTKKYFSFDMNEKLTDFEESIQKNVAAGMDSFEIKYKIIESRPKVDDPTTNEDVEVEKTLKFDHDSEYNTLYFRDETELTELEFKYRQNRHVIGQINLDNLDELLANEDVNTRVQLQATYFSIVGKWAEKFDLYLKAISDERFIFICDYEQLEILIADEFKLLDEIRNARPDSPIKIAASIGIGCDENSVLNTGYLANDSLDQAFNRGGDQTVIQILGESIKFIGGKTETIAKKSRTKSRMISMQLLQLISQSDNVVILTHKSPDQDAFGAAIGTMKIAEHAGKETFLYFDLEKADESVQRMYNEYISDDAEFATKLLEIDRDLENSEVPTSILDVATSNTLFVIVDANNPTYIEGNITGSECSDNLVVIDHHRRGTDMYMAKLNYIEPYSSSTVELVVELLQYIEDLTLTATEATILLTGIFVDTMSFSSKTGTKTFDAASYLREQGADMTKVKMNLREDFEVLRSRAKMISEAIIYNERFALLVTEELTTQVQLAKMAGELLMTNQISAAFAIGYIDKDTVCVSARSFAEVNVQILMEKLGGGGHITAAATTRQADIGTLVDELSILLEELDEE